MPITIIDPPLQPWRAGAQNMRRFFILILLVISVGYRMTAMAASDPKDVGYGDTEETDFC